MQMRINRKHELGSIRHAEKIKINRTVLSQEASVQIKKNTNLKLWLFVYLN